MAKNRKTTDTDLAWYRSGFLDAENKYQQIVTYLEYENELLKKTNTRLEDENELYKKTNVRLYEDLQRVEKDKPRTGVLITYKFADSLINNAKKGNRWGRSLASRLAKRVKEAQEKDAKAVLLSIEENGPVEL